MEALGKVEKLLISFLDVASSVYMTFDSFLRSRFELNETDVFPFYNPDITPWHYQIAKWVDDPTVEWIYLFQGSQTGKTTIEMAALLYFSKREAINIFWAMDTRDSVKRFIKERLRPFLDGYDDSAINSKTWKIEAFRLFQSCVLAAYGSTEESFRSYSAQVLIGDECSAWEFPISLYKKRARMFKGTGKCKGLFASTPPETKDHPFWTEASAENFHCWEVRCDCGGFFRISPRKHVVWDLAAKRGDTWDMERVKATTKVICPHCGLAHPDEHRIKMVQGGRAQMVDPNTFEPVDGKPMGDSRTLQVSSWNSHKTSWGENAVMFLKAEREKTMRVYIRDELAEVPGLGEDEELPIRGHTLDHLINPSRKRGWQDGYDLYTAGVDIQKKSNFWVLWGWRKGLVITGHLLDHGNPHWGEQINLDVLKEIFSMNLGKIAAVAIDVSDGKVTQIVESWCLSSLHPFMPLTDKGNRQASRIMFHPIMIDPTKQTKLDSSYYPKRISINSVIIKDEISSAFERSFGEEGAWTLPVDTEEQLKQHFCNEKRAIRDGKVTWEPRYSGAPQHYFSAAVYGVAARSQFDVYLQETVESIKPPERAHRRGVVYSARQKRGW